MWLLRLGYFGLVTLLLAGSVSGQSPNGIINGLVLDVTGGVVVAAEIRIANDATGVQYVGKTNGEGIYVLTNLPPGTYRLQVSKIGFKTLIKPDIILNVQDSLAINFTLLVGAASEIVTVTGGAPLMNTESAAVSTVVDRQFAENLPMNGRSFQSLIQLTPGVVLTPSTANDGGQFSVNGQRSSSNYWMVDGVSANIGMSANAIAGNGLGGALGSFSAVGGTNSLVSVDAMQEFRIQTSTYAPEFGRTPGAQISILTRSGTNEFHGTVFDYLRNDVFDANDWFADNAGLAKPEERQNDFGGTFSGPIAKGRTFFFFSYEGLRLRLPQVGLTTVPCDASCKVAGNVRSLALPALQPYLNAYPLPNGPETFTPCTPATDPACPPTGEAPTGTAQFNSSYSNAATLDAYSLRIDHKLNDKVNFFGHYNYSPSEISARGNGDSLNVVNPSRITTQYGTVGTTWALSPRLVNDLRFNYSRTNSSGSYYEDNFGGAVPLDSAVFPGPFTTNDALFEFRIFSLTNGQNLFLGNQTASHQSQVNVVDSLSWQRDSHSLKFGVDFRRLSPLFAPLAYGQENFFSNVAAAQTGNLLESVLLSSRGVPLNFNNLGLFAQDTWRVARRLTLTYGLRWDVDFAPSSRNGPNLSAVTGFNLNNLANLALAPAGTPPFNTSYGNVAPRIGMAYQLSQSQNWQSVLRGGFGVFYDLVTSDAGNDLNGFRYPFGALALQFGSFPLSSAAAAPPPIAPPNANTGVLFAFDPNIRLPYTLEWNVAFEQALGQQQTISASYIGSAGRRLLQTETILLPNPNYAAANLIANTATSNYNALQLQFERRLSHGLQVLASYTWSHSIDDASSGSYANNSDVLVSALNPNANRGPSDFDIRNAFSAGLTYDVPSPKINALTKAILSDWSLQSLVQARSAPPVDVSDSALSQNGFANGITADIRPDLVPGQPLYLFGAECAAVFGPLGMPCAGGKGFNPAAFTDPPFDPNTGIALRQGDVPRNFLRGFGATQWDFAIHREFPIHESLKLQFRAEMFNVLNHPNFGPPSGAYNSAQFGGPAGFGTSTQMLGQFLNGGTSGLSNVGGGAFSPLYQIGGPRSMQFALKLLF